MYDRFCNYDDHLKFLYEIFIDLGLITFYCSVPVIRAMVSLSSMVLFLIPPSYNDFDALISFAQKIVVHNRLT